MAREKLVLKDEEKVKEVLERIQHCSRGKDRYLLMIEDTDWFVVLQALQDSGYVRTNPERQPLKEFAAWLQVSGVPQHIAHCDAYHLSKVCRSFAGARYPWDGVKWDPYILRRWRTLYEGVLKFLNE